MGPLKGARRGSGYHGGVRIPLGKTERRLAMAILLSAIVPLLAAIFLASSLFKQASSIWFNPEIGQQLDRGVDVYKDYVRALKDDMKHQADAMSANETLQEAATQRNAESLESELNVVFPRFPSLVTLQIEDADGNVLARRDRGRPVDEATERSLEVRRALAEDPDDPAAPQLVVTFAIARARLDELEKGGLLVTSYHQVVAARGELYRGYIYAFAILLGITFLLSIMAGTVLARGVTRRINRLAAAIDLVGQGDLAVRVPVTGSDRLTELARTFNNRMLGDDPVARADRVPAAHRRVAGDGAAPGPRIGNPLTPIQLAVQECHRKYVGDDAASARCSTPPSRSSKRRWGRSGRLVGDFSNFARLCPTSSSRRRACASSCATAPTSSATSKDTHLGEHPGEGWTRDSPRQRGHRVAGAGRGSAHGEPSTRARCSGAWWVNLIVRNAVRPVPRRPRRADRTSGERRGREAAPEGAGSGVEPRGGRRAHRRSEDDGPRVPEEARSRLRSVLHDQGGRHRPPGLADRQEDRGRAGGRRRHRQEPASGGALRGPPARAGVGVAGICARARRWGHLAGVSAPNLRRLPRPGEEPVVMGSAQDGGDRTRRGFAAAVADPRRPA